MLLKLIALPEKQELRKTDLVNLIGQLSACTRESVFIALNQFRRPVEVICAVVLGLQRPE